MGQIEEIYQHKKFVGQKVTGILDPDDANSIARQIINLAYLFPDKNILVDLRETTVSLDFLQQMNLAMEIGEILPVFKNKVAHLVPDDEKRLSFARQFESCMILKGYSYKVFNNFDQATEWLSEPF
ncbi:MAG: hypothetical protein C0616_15140 [Desulfuromonas sp.]|nr:MAG: hypothetical protein C0616_15140 [Desulfuromonas sp.]